MKDIFAELYKKVVSFFNKTDAAEGEENAKDVACNRLKLVLMQDRTNLTPAIMDRMRKELIELLSKYMELDRELLDLNFEQEDNQMALMLSIPVIRAKNEDEIQEILDKEDEEKRKLEELAKSENADKEESDDISEDDEAVSEEEEENEDSDESDEDDSEEEDDDDDDDDDIDEVTLSDDDDDEDDEEDDDEDSTKKKEKFFSEKKIK